MSFFCFHQRTRSTFVHACLFSVCCCISVVVIISHNLHSFLITTTDIMSTLPKPVILSYA